MMRQFAPAPWTTPLGETGSISDSRVPEIQPTNPLTRTSPTAHSATRREVVLANGLLTRMPFDLQAATLVLAELVVLSLKLSYSRITSLCALINFGQLVQTDSSTIP